MFLPDRWADRQSAFDGDAAPGDDHAGGRLTPPGTIRCEEIPRHADYRRLAGLPVRVDLRYAGPRNLVGCDLYGPDDCAFLHREAAAGLASAARRLAGVAPSLELVVLDALRPQRAQERLWEAVRGGPLERYVAPPALGSIHTFGRAVDVTIAERGGAELDMGTAFDDLTELSHPEHEERLLREGRLQKPVIANRALLRECMAHGGFAGIPHEWWHFDHGDRATIRATGARVL